MTALHFGDGHGGAHEGVELAAALFANAVKQGTEKPKVGEDHAVKEA